MSMLTRSIRTAQAAATGRSAPHTSIQVNARRQAKVPKGRGAALRANVTVGRGRGAAQAAAVGSTPGIPDVDLATAQPNQLVLYEDEEADQGLPESPNFSNTNSF